MRYWAAVGLHTAGKNAGVAPAALHDALKDPSPVVRIEAAAALSELENITEPLQRLEKEGVLKIPYPHLVEIWKANMNTGIWCANAQARRLMDKGVVPPGTADPSLNRFAPYNLAGQFCVEAYGMIAPGMPQSAADLGLHYARVSVSGEPLQAAQYRTTLLSLAAVSSEPLEELLKKSLSAVDPASTQEEAVREGIKAFHRHPTDWKAARRYFHDKCLGFRKS